MPLLKTSSGVPVVPIWIDGKASPLDESRFITVHSASQKKDIHFAQAANPTVAKEAAASALRAFSSWKETTHSHRRDLLLRVADIYERRMDELVRYQCEETSCQEAWARFNVALAVKALRETASSITAACTGEIPPLETPGAFCLVYKEAIGPVLSIVPWNGAMILSTRAIAAPIGAGCTVVLKASELCPRTHHAIVEAFMEAGLPPGCLNQIQMARESAPAVTEALIADNAIRKVEFIGSATVGRIIGQVASKHLKPVLMELGGKGPALVLKDADLKRAAKLCALGAFLHHGQICMSTDRIIVVREVADEFSKYLVEEVKHGYSEGVGFAVSPSIAKHAQLLLDEASKQGATYLVGDNRALGDTGASLNPTIVTGVKSTDRLYDEETFGPSASLYVVEDEAQAIKLANESSYGLNAAVHSRDVFSALRVARQLEYGQVNVNTITEFDEASAPIGGVKGSGWGRNNGKFGLREFLVEKMVSVHEPDASLNFG
jgi:acyl-CoA reductase-like NAD-dependent aldehyde dehydrogenase